MLSVGIALFVFIPGERHHPDDAVPLGQYAGGSISAGSTAYVSDGGGSIGIGADLETLTALADAVGAKDRRAYEHLFQKGHAFLVEDRVRVRVVALQENTAQVQFLEGYHSQQSGFVLRQWLRPER
jgi:hypothetical protein